MVNLPSRELFDEDLYLRTFPDVAQAVRAGRFPSGYDHWALHGRIELAARQRVAESSFLLDAPDQGVEDFYAAATSKPIKGISAVFLKGDMVYANLDDDLINPDFVLIQSSNQIPFEPWTVSSLGRFDFDITENVDLVVDGKKKVKGPSLFVNTFQDRNVTLEIEVEKSDPPYRMNFRKPIVVEGASSPLSFRANIATDGAYANLIVTFTDLDTQEAKVHSVEFERKFDRRVTDEYQKVDITAPEGISNIAVAISIDYLSCTEEDVQAPTLLLISDMHLLEPGQEYSDRMSRPDALEGQWIQAKADASREGFEFDTYWNENSYWPEDARRIFIRSGDDTTVIMTHPVEVASHFFDQGFYEEQNRDLDLSHIDAFSHYLLTGWKEFRNPGPEFCVREYLLRNPDVEAADAEPLIHYANLGVRQNRSLGGFDEKINEIWNRSGKTMPDGEQSAIFARAQDMMVPLSIINSRKIAVFVVPEHDAMSGGIFSFFSIADHAQRTRRLHGYDVLVMTRPNPRGLTYVRASAFQNSHTVLRLEQLRLFAEVSDLQIHIPEYATVDFVRSLSPELMKYLLRRDCLHINIMNQNIRKMPEAEVFRDLRRISTTIGQSVSHVAFFKQELANRYNLPTLLLPAYTDLSHYPALAAEKKENIIIYSNDDSSYRQAVLKRLEQLDDYNLIQIKDMTFDTYMDLATRCKFSVTFGEGFDGYVAQPIYQGGIGFALYNDEFFPNSSFKRYENFFETEEEMIEQIVPTIRRLETDQKSYVALNKALRTRWNKLYKYEDYVERIVKLMRNEYELFPDGPSIVHNGLSGTGKQVS
jgi:hypothetical protein